MVSIRLFRGGISTTGLCVGTCKRDDGASPWGRGIGVVRGLVVATLLYGIDSLVKEADVDLLPDRSAAYT